MPFGKWRNFKDCVRDFVSKGKDEESARRICGYLQSRLGKESFSWVGDIKVYDKNLIRGKALHPIMTVHPEEWPSVRVYLEEELKRAAHTLAGKPLLLDHLYPIDGRVLGAEYEDGAIEYFAEVHDERILEWVRDGTIKHCSVEYEWSSLERVNGVAPRGIQFTGLALLKNFEPGDPESTVEVWESIIERLKETRQKIGKEAVLSERVWTRNYINNLPDDAFAIILPGGKKDEEGKTVPRSLRKFPHHNMAGDVDLPHLRNANARVEQSSLTTAQKAMALAHLNRHKKALGIGEAGEEETIQRLMEQASEESEEEIGYVPEVPGGLDVTSEPSLDEVINSVEEALFQIDERIDGVVETVQSLRHRVEALEREITDKAHRTGEAVIEPPTETADVISRREVVKELKQICLERVPHHWGFGPYKQNMRLKALIKRLEAGSG